MRYIVIVFLMAGFFISVVPASAQASTFEQGYYNFEDTIASMTYAGSWSTVNISGVGARQTTSGVSHVSFGVEGRTLVVWRLMRQSLPTSMQLCVNHTGCITIDSNTTAAQYWYPFVVTLPSGFNYITIHWVSGGVLLDSFMVLSDADLSAGMPTAVPTVPTATILPSSTPAFTATPQPTSTPGNTPVDTATAVPTATPQPTATPYTVPDAFYAIDPAARYGMVNGQITVTRYEMRASDYTSQYLLGVLVIINLVAVGLAIWKRK